MQLFSIKVSFQAVPMSASFSYVGDVFMLGLSPSRRLKGNFLDVSDFRSLNNA